MLSFGPHCGVQDYCVLGLLLHNIFMVISLQDGVGWGILTVIGGITGGANNDSQEEQMRPQVQDLLRFELFTVKDYRTGPFSK